MSKLQDFLADYDNASTRAGYQSAVYGFIKYVYDIKPQKGKVSKRSSPEDKIKIDKLIDKYLSEKRDFKDDLMGFRTSMKDRPPLSQRQTINLVNEFLACNGVVIPHADMKRIRRKIKGGTATSESEFDIGTIRKILMFMDLKGRALLLMLISSGMRIGETLQLRDSDIDLTSTPVKIRIRMEYTKTRQERITFITPQAAEALKAWLPLRKEYLKSSNGKNKGLVAKGLSAERGSNGDHIFPFAMSTANQILENAVNKAGLMSKDEKTKRSQIHLHMTRKFFLSQSSLLASSKEIPETLAGHGGNMTEAYRRYTVRQLAEEYQKVQHLLTITDEEELRSIEVGFKTTMQRHDTTLAAMSVENAEQKTEINELKARLAAIEQQQAAITKMSMENWKQTEQDLIAALREAGADDKEYEILKNGIQKFHNKVRQHSART
jgi:integrase